MTVDSNYSCSYGVNGTMTLYESERTGTDDGPLHRQ